LFVEGSTLPHRFTDFTKVKLTRGSEIPLKPSTNDKWDIEVTCICVLPSTNILVGENYNTSLRIIDQTSEIISIIGLPCAPHSICTLSLDRVAFILPFMPMIQIASVAGDRIILQENIPLKMKKTRYSGLRLLNNNFVLGTSDGRVVKVNRDGIEILSTQNKTTLFKNPVNIEVANADIYVADYGTHTITCMNEMLEVLQTFKYPGHIGPFVIMFVGGEQILVRGARPDRPWSMLQVLETTKGTFKELFNVSHGAKEGHNFPYWSYCPRLGKLYMVKRSYNLEMDSYNETIVEYVYKHKGT